MQHPEPQVMQWGSCCRAAHIQSSQDLGPDAHEAGAGLQSRGGEPQASVQTLPWPLVPVGTKTPFPDLPPRDPFEAQFPPCVPVAVKGGYPPPQLCLLLFEWILFLQRISL